MVSGEGASCRCSQADRRVQELGVGRERDGLGLRRGVHRDAGKVVAAQRASLMRNPQVFGQEQFQLVANARGSCRTGYRCFDLQSKPTMQRPAQNPGRVVCFMQPWLRCSGPSREGH